MIQFLSYVSKLNSIIFGDFWGFYFLEANISIFYFSVFVNLEKIILKNFCQTLSLKRGLYTPIHVYSCITLNHFELPILGPLSRTDSAAQRETGALQALQKARNLEFDRNFTSISNFNKTVIISTNLVVVGAGTQASTLGAQYH